MSKLIVVCGLGGSGKTTLSKSLSKKLNIVCFNKDTIKVGLYDRLGVETDKTFKLYFYLAEEQVKNEVDVMMESPFTHRSDLDLLKKWVKEYGVEITFVVCTIDNETRKNRIETRLRHDCHGEADALALRQEHITFDSFHFPGKVIHVTTDRPVDDLVEYVCREI